MMLNILGALSGMLLVVALVAIYQFLNRPRYQPATEEMKRALLRGPIDDGLYK